MPAAWTLTAAHELSTSSRGPGRRSRSLVAHLAAIGSSTVLLFLMIEPVLGSTLGAVDDHEIVAIVGKDGQFSIREVPGLVAKADASIGRFRPMYWIGRGLECALAGRDASLWYVNRLALSFVTLVAIYVAAVGFTGRLAAAVIALLPFSGPQFETWIRLGANETYATPLVALALAWLGYSAARNRLRPAQLVPTHALLALAALAKENFLLLLIAALPLTMVVAGLRRMKRSDYAVVAGTAAFIVINAIAIVLQLSDHGSIYPTVRSTGSLISETRYTVATLNHYTFALLAVVISAALSLRSRAVSKRGLGLFLVATAAVGLPQLLFYAGYPQEARYLYPRAFIAAACWVFLFWMLTRALPAHSRTASLTFVVVLLIPLALGTQAARTKSEAVRLETNEFQRSIEEVAGAARGADTETIILQPWDAQNDFETIYALATYLATDYDLTVMTLPPEQARGPYGETLGEALIASSRHGGRFLTAYAPVRPCVAVQLGQANPAACETALTFPR